MVPAQPLTRSADFQSISICENRRGPRRFWSAVASEARHRFRNVRERSQSGVALRFPPHSKTLVVAWPRYAVSQNCILQVVVTCERGDFVHTVPIKNRRYSRLQICATSWRG